MANTPTHVDAPVSVTAAGIIATTPRVKLRHGHPERATLRLACPVEGDEPIWFNVILTGRDAQRANAGLINAGSQVIVTGTLRIRLDTAITAGITIDATSIATIQQQAQDLHDAAA